MGRKNTNEDVQRRREAVEEHISRGDWSLKRQAQVARQFDVSPDQVRKDAAWVRRMWASQQQEQTPDEMRSDWRQRVHKAMRDAAEIGHTHTVAKLLATEARVLGLEAAVQLEVSHKVTHTIEDAPRLAADVLKALPVACKVLGIDAPALPVIDVDAIEVDE